MAVFNDLAIEIQEAIWKLVLPASRGVQWIEVEGIPHDPDFVRDSIRMTEWHKFDRLPETPVDYFRKWESNPEFKKRAKTKNEESTPFFRELLTTVPAVFGQLGSDDNAHGHEGSVELQCAFTDEVADTRRCRQLSTYYQIAVLLSACRLSRYVAEQYIQDNGECSWPIHRSMGSPYKPRPIAVWKAQYSDNKAPPGSTDRNIWQTLSPRIHALDLVVFRLWDNQGRPTPLLEHGPWQFVIESWGGHWTTFGCFSRVGIEWHPSWATRCGTVEFCSGNVAALVRTMQTHHFGTNIYWLVDGVPRPDWKRDYPAFVRDMFERRMAEDKNKALQHLGYHWRLSNDEKSEMLADHHLGQEFEANGRRYYIVFVVFGTFVEDEDALEEAGLGHCGPFPGSASMWPEAIREPVRLAYAVHRDGSSNLGTLQDTSFIMSWEPIC